MDTVHLKLIYDGKGPIHWSRAPDAFGLQDKDAVLHLGKAGAKGTVVFDFALQVKDGSSEVPVLLGDFAHGPPSARFVYLGWRNEQGAFAQRLKLPLSGITWSDVREAQRRGQPLVGTLVDHHPRVTTTGANIGGMRPMVWALA